MTEPDKVATGELPTPEQEAQATLVAEIGTIIEEARRWASLSSWWAKIWHVFGFLIGLTTALLAAIAGIAGLASTTGRVPAAILALVAAGMTAGNQFIRSDDRFTNNLRRRNAWEALYRDALLEKAYAGTKSTDQLYEIVRGLLSRRLTIRGMENDLITPDVAAALLNNPREKRPTATTGPMVDH
jgi:hypothetical protein